MIGKIEQKTENNITVVQKIKPKKDANGFFNSTLWVAAITILGAMIASYFVQLKFDGQVHLTDFTINAIWLAIGTYIIGVLIKRITYGKARTTEEYVVARKEADEGTKRIADNGYSDKIPEYCRSYEEKRKEATIQEICKNACLSYSDYTAKYEGKSIKEILKEYPSDKLFKAQKRAIKSANAVKIHRYDPDFLRFESVAESYISPSEAYSFERKDKINNLTSLAMTLFSSVFVCSLLTDVFTNFSKEVIILAVMKIATIIINGISKCMFAWNNVMNVEVARFRLKKAEAKCCFDFCSEKK